MIKIALSMRNADSISYEEKRDAISHDWIRLIANLNLIPILIPNSLPDIQSYLNNIEPNIVILTGGEDIVVEDIEHQEKNPRSFTENRLIESAIKLDIPIIGVCRGMQFINAYFSGYENFNKGHLKKDNLHVNTIHNIEIKNDYYSNNIIETNSFHENIINDNELAENLIPFAYCSKDNSVEGFYHPDAKIIGIQWHPERNHLFNLDDDELLLNILLGEFNWNQN